MIKSREDLIKAYIEFFKSKGHKEIPNASLVPSIDPTVLFTTAGMHPIVPYLLGEKHPLGKRLVNVQKCIRTGDIDEVGDEVHHTFFEMLGNWSLGDYWKKEAIEFTFEFHTKVLGIPIERYAITVFSGNKNAEKDDESVNIWKSLGIKDERIAYVNDNWWGPAGATGPCGPDTEQFYWSSEEEAPKKFNPDDKRWVEIGNDVLMQYIKNENGKYLPAKQKNIDFGGGVERTLAGLNGLSDNYKTSCFQPIIKEIEKLSGKKYKGNEKSMRIIADHIKAGVFIINDGVVPSNVERGYVLRRLIRRAIRYGHLLGIKENFTAKLVDSVIKIYPDYAELKKNRNQILTELDKEENRFREVIEEGIKLSEKIIDKKIPIKKEKYIRLMELENKSQVLKTVFENKKTGKKYALPQLKLTEKEIDDATINGEDAFLLYQSYGFPIEMIYELAQEKNLIADKYGFLEAQAKHQKLSRTASAGQFKSGLADNSDATKKLHTAAHLLDEALREVLKDKNIKQKGSNITPERLRFDFNFPRKLEEKEIKELEDWVNDKIKKKIPVKREEMAFKKAVESGAGYLAQAKYPEIVSVYSIGAISKEICTGPHVNNTSELGKFKIQKEESSASGIRRIKAILE